MSRHQILDLDVPHLNLLVGGLLRSDNKIAPLGVRDQSLKTPNRGALLPW